MLEILTTAASGDLSVLATVKNELKIATTDDDVFLTRAIKAASGAIARHCGRTTFGREGYRQTEFLRRDEDALILGRDIDVDISSVSVDAVVLASGDWFLDDLLVRRLTSANPSCWSAGTKVVLEYEAGYLLLGTVPYELEQACLDLVRRAYTSKDRDPALRSERVLDLSEVTFFGSSLSGKSGGLPPDIAARLEDFRLWPTK